MRNDSNLRGRAPRTVSQLSAERPRARSATIKAMASLKDVASCFRVSRQAVWRWVKLGQLRGRKSRRDGVLRVSRSEIQRFARRSHRPLLGGGR